MLTCLYVYVYDVCAVSVYILMYVCIYGWCYFSKNYAFFFNEFSN